jgi:molybdopterin molybdotransferase
MLHVLPLDEAINLLAETARKNEAQSEQIPLSNAAGRVFAADVESDFDLPAFDRSAVDGYAVLAADTFGASSAQPALLRLAGEVRMGELADFEIGAGTCGAVWTGGALPHGADAAVMIEETERLPGGFVAMESSVAPGRNVVFRGDDARAGQTLLPKGTRLSARDIGLLAAFGFARVLVQNKPRVNILSTGDELVDPSETPAGAQVRDINGPMLAAACEDNGAETRFLGRVPDDEETLLDVMRGACSDCNLLLLSGGSSAGAKDAAARCLEKLGQIFFHGLALKPGKPAFAGRVGDTLVIGLPGHPSAAYLVFHALVKPILAALAGESPRVRTSPAALTQAVSSNHGREELLLVRLDEEQAEPVPSKSGLVLPLTRADGYVRIPRDTEGLAKGARVDVFLF